MLSNSIEYCTAPVVKYASYSPMVKYYNYGDRVYIECHDGYTRYQTGFYMKYSTCNKYGKWENLPECKQYKYSSKKTAVIRNSQSVNKRSKFNRRRIVQESSNFNITKIT